ncbi:MAG: helix-turn-helix transcriptional regulator [Alphaproteobacteria bacterium]|nr:helix-turn-helix transcriptional regulator [Alphaproteobacteria bacterium]
MKVNVNQIRAARGLLNWSQKDLAARSGISNISITHYESGKTTPHRETQDKIIQALELEGVVFTMHGVEMKTDTVTTIEGEGWYMRLLDDVYYSLMDKKDAELLILCADDAVSPPAVNNRYRKIRNAGIAMRQLVKEGNTYLMGPLKEYKYIPAKKFRNYVSLVYGDKVAICTDNNSKALIFKDAQLSETWRNIFDVLWDELSPPKESTADERF